MEVFVACALCESLGSNNGNVLPNTDEAKKNHAQVHFEQSKILNDGITEDEILQRCFMTVPKTERPALSLIECRQLLLDLCKSLVKHQPKTPTTICNMCSVGISIKQNKAQNSEYNMANHACAHLVVKIFECGHCDRTWSHRISIMHHIRRVHYIKKPTAADFVDKTVEQFNEIFDQITRCFSASYPRASGTERQFIIKSNSKDKSRLAVVHFCRSIFIQRSKPASVECNLCGVPISLLKTDRGRPFSPPAMFRHAAAHLEVKLFTCRHCNKSMSTKPNMTIHLRDAHQIVDGNSGDFDDQSEKFHSVYLHMIKRCFSAVHVKLEDVPSTEKKITIKAEARIRGQKARTPGSKLDVERRLFHCRLIKELAEHDGKIKCSLCSMRIAVISSAERKVRHRALLHVESHLQKPLYRCKVCGRPFTTQNTLAFHLKSKHALGMNKNYECFVDDFHDEFMAMMSKCFVPNKI